MTRTGDPLSRRSLRGMLALCIALAAACLAQPQDPSNIDPASREASATIDPLRPLSAFTGVTGSVSSGPTEVITGPVAEAITRARALVADKDFPAAAELLSEIEDSTASEIPYLIALTRERLGDPAGALEAARRAAALRPGAADYHYLLGRLLADSDEPAEAREQFRSATLAADTEITNPRVAAAWFRLAELLQDQGYLLAASEALACFDAMIWDTHAEYRSAEDVLPILAAHPRGGVDRRIELLQKLQRAGPAADVAGWALKHLPPDPVLVRLYARTLLAAGRVRETLEFCRARLVDEPNSKELIELAVLAARQSGGLPDWIAAVEQDVRAAERTELARALAQQLMDNGMSADAARLWSALRDENPGDDTLVWSLALALQQSGEVRGALLLMIDHARAAGAALDLPPRAFAPSAAGAAEDAGFDALVGELASAPGADATTRLVLAMAAQAREKTDLAQRLMQECLEAAPEFVAGRVAWGRMLLAQYRWKDALEQARLALERQPESAAAFFLRAEACAGLDENSAAEEAYRAAARLAPKESAYAVACGKHSRRIGDLRAAQRYFQQASQEDPSCYEALEELIDCYLGDDKLEIAQEQFARSRTGSIPDDVLRRLETALRFAEAPFQDEHLAELARQFQEHPKDVATGLKLAAGLFVNGRSEAAGPVLRSVLEQRSQDERAQMLLARVQLSQLDASAAIDTLDGLARRFPNRREVLELLAAANLNDFRVQAGVTLLARIAETGGSVEQVKRARAMLVAAHVTFRQFDEALRGLERWIQQDPSEELWLRTRIQTLLLAERPDRAVRAAEEWLVRDVQDEARRDVFLETCIEARQFDQARERLDAWLLAEPGSGPLEEWRLQLLFAERRFDEGLRILEAQTSPTWQRAVARRMWIGRYKIGAGQVDEGVSEYLSLLEDQAIAGNPDAIGLVRRQVMTQLVLSGAAARAVELCDRWLGSTEPGDILRRIELLELKRLALQSIEDREQEYASVMEELLTFRPQDTPLNNDLGYSWVDRGLHLERATAMIRQALADSPLNPAYLDSLGWAYYKAGDFSKAALYLGRAVSVQGGEDPVLFDHLGDAAFRTGKESEARESWEKALALIEEEQNPVRAAEHVKLAERIRGKLAALKDGQTPTTAPLVEQKR